MALSRREREKLRQREEILAVALELFSSRGYHNVSMHEVAEKAEFAVGTLYKFFKNKDDLYRDLIHETFGKFEAALLTAIAEPVDEVDKLRSYVKVKAEIFRANVSMITLYFANSQGARVNIASGLDTALRKRHEDFLQRLAAIFKSGIKRKRFRKIADPYHLAITLESFTNAFLFLWLDQPDVHPYPEDPDMILNILFKGLVDT